MLTRRHPVLKGLLLAGTKLTSTCMTSQADPIAVPPARYVFERHVNGLSSEYCTLRTSPVTFVGALRTGDTPTEVQYVRIRVKQSQQPLVKPRGAPRHLLPNIRRRPRPHLGGTSNG
jgi:hypothetical protein